MKKDIANRADIQLLVDTFYNKVKADETIGYLFNDVANVNWEHHLPRMYDFGRTSCSRQGALKATPWWPMCSCIRNRR